MAARRAAEDVAADGKWRTAQEKRERAQQNRKGLGAQRQRMRSSKSEEHIARSEQLRRAQSDSLVTVPPPPPPMSVLEASRGVPGRGAPGSSGGSGWLGAPTGEAGSLSASSHRLGCSS